MRTINYAQAIREAMSEEMRRDEDAIFIGEDIGIYGGAFGVSVGMLQEFGPERVRNTPISEAAIVGAATGAALTGLRPIAEIMFSDFLTISTDQIVNQAAKLRYMFGGKAKVPMVVRMPEGSGTGAAAQHSQSLEAWFCHIPGLIVVAPSTPYDAKGLLKSAIRNDNPVMFFEQKLLYRKSGEVPEEEYVIPIGKADIKRQGRDVTVITYGRMLQVCLEVADKLAKEGIEMEVMDLRTLRPLDTDCIISSVKKTGRALVVHEACLTGGLGGEIAAIITGGDAFFSLKAPVHRLCGLDVPIPYCPELEKNVVPTVETVERAVRELKAINHRASCFKITPFAQKIALEKAVDPAECEAAKRNQRIYKADIEALLKGRAEAKAMSKMRKTIATRMLQSHLEVPPVTLEANADVTALAGLKRAYENDGVKLTYNDFVVYAVAKALAQTPQLNMSYHEDGIVPHEEINIGMAVALEDGLVVPVINRADRLSLGELSAEAKRLAEKARKGALLPQEVEGSTFTVSNLGMFGVTFFTPIVNQPNCAILGICAIEKRLLLEKGAVVERQRMGLSLTFDHRVVDGAQAAMFLKKVCELIEGFRETCLR